MFSKCKFKLVLSFCSYHEEYASDDGIEFQHESKSISDSTASSVSAIQENNSTDTEVVKKVDFMYIQMEFCEKSTLRTAIDTGLFDDRVRVWRLFREIVEGKQKAFHIFLRILQGIYLVITIK